MKTIQIEVPEGKRAEWVNGVLTLVDDKQQDITERIKTFEDARIWCESNGQHDICRAYYAFQTELISDEDYNKDILAYLKLRIITCALNEGWEPKFDEREERWSPTYDVTDFSFNKSYSQYTDTFTHGSKSSLLLLKSRKLAEYAATQFKDIYMDFCYKGKE